jgi:DNA-binding MarR family transcriptional regulator
VEFDLKREDALKIADLTADLMMVIGRMKRSARSTEGNDLHPGTEFAILDTVQRHGCRTVPEIAAWRGVARQSVQSVVNKLLEGKLIEQSDNPDHKLSPLLGLTVQGAIHYGQVRELMCARYSAVQPELNEGDLSAAERVIAAIAQTWGAGSRDA